MTTKRVSAKKQRLQNLLERLEGGEDVSVRDLKGALTDNEFSEYEQSWVWHQKLRSNAFGGSSGYDALFKKGLFHYNKAECGRFNKEASNRYRKEAQGVFERALEQLKCDVETDPIVMLAYDRELNFSFDGNLSLSPAGMPRRVTSKSLDNLSDVNGGQRVKKTKRDFKIEIVKKGLAEFGNRTKETEVDDGETEMGHSNVKYGDAQGAKLADLLKGLKRG